MISPRRVRHDTRPAAQPENPYAPQGNPRFTPMHWCISNLENATIPPGVNRCVRRSPGAARALGAWVVAHALIA